MQSTVCWTKYNFEDGSDACSTRFKRATALFQLDGEGCEMDQKNCDLSRNLTKKKQRDSQSVLEHHWPALSEGIETTEHMNTGEAHEYTRSSR